jgi:hypothetical protein
MNAISKEISVPGIASRYRSPAVAIGPVSGGLGAQATAAKAMDVHARTEEGIGRRMVVGRCGA